MSVEGQKSYPGETATPEQIMALASEYRRAADALLRIGRPGQPLSRAPYRLVAIHAIELYLNAYLLATGHPHALVRGLQHDLASRTQLAIDAGLCLKKLTQAHLQTISKTREYLISRYDPAISGASELNRLGATLDEVEDKVTRFIGRSAAEAIGKSAPAALSAHP